MTADEALEAHRRWKTRFREAMGSREPLNVAEISADNCCAFGKWLHSDAKSRFGTLASYAVCVERHAEFHVEAGKVAQLIGDGNFVGAERSMAHDSAYAETSNTLAIAVRALFKDANGNSA